MKKVSFSLLLIVALIVVLVTVFGTKVLQFKAMGASAEGMGPPPETVSTFEVVEQVWTKNWRAVGSIEPIQGILLETEIGGVVQSINFENGQNVALGDLLVQLDVEVERAELRAAEALARLAEVELERAKRLRESGNVPQSDLDRAVAEAQRAKAQVDNLQARIDRKTIRAPFSGQVGIRQINLGQFVPSGAPIVALQANETVYANFSLPQQALDKIETGYAIKLTSDVYPERSFEGSLTAISPEIDPTTRSVALQGTFDNADGLLRAGLFVRVEVSLPTKSTVVVVPSTAILYAPYGNSVYKIEHEATGPVARQHFVSLGEHKGDFVSIVKGVEVGEVVVSAGAFKLRNGSTVTINNDLAPEPKLDPKPNNS